MRIVISGATGLIGRRLVAHLRAQGCQVERLVRGTAARPDEIAWDPAAGRIDAARLEGCDAVVHLAGESAARRWTPERKAAIRDSRIRGTRLIAETLARLAQRPAVLISASAIGYYGDRGDTVLTEQSDPGTGFLSEVARGWEAVTEPARQAGIRVVNLRIGVVLAREGGALGAMLTPFRLGLGSWPGRGRQHWSWIAREDLVRAVAHLLDADLAGPVNAVAPQPVTSREFARTLGRVLWRPVFLRAPAWLIRLLLGEMGRAMLLSSTRVLPQALSGSGFEFRYPALADALRAELALQPEHQGASATLPA